MAEIFTWVRDANRRIDAGEAVGGSAQLRELLTILGLETVFESAGGEADDESQALLERREAARAARDFALADQLRDELLERGWVIRDTADGPQLRPA